VFIRVAALSRFLKERRVYFIRSIEFVRHRAEEKSMPRPFKPERVGHPATSLLYLYDVTGNSFLFCGQIRSSWSLVRSV
jgi:hypothetical protein